MEDSKLNWYALKVFYNKVFEIEALLGDMGLETYIPVRQVQLKGEEHLRVARRLAPPRPPPRPAGPFRGFPIPVWLLPSSPRLPLPAARPSSPRPALAPTPPEPFRRRWYLWFQQATFGYPNFFMVLQPPSRTWRYSSSPT